MQLFRTSQFLRRVLLADAVTCGASGLLMIFRANAMERLLGIPAPAVRYAGLSLLPFAALLVYLTRRESLSRRVVWVIIAANALWAMDSILLLLTGWIEPTATGQAFIIAQAVVVALFADAQYLGLRRSPANAA